LRAVAVAILRREPLWANGPVGQGTPRKSLDWALRPYSRSPGPCKLTIYPHKDAFGAVRGPLQEGGMEQNLRLGRVSGVPIGINWSILIIFFLIAWELGGLVLPADRPHQAQAIYWTIGIATTVLFFASLLAHEASHTVVARRNGIGVRRITLWLFGGVSELENEALTPGVDFRVAVVGPLTSFVLAGIFGAAAFVLRHANGGVGVVASAFGWLAWMNILLGGFNLMPAAPLDGGRVLRAALWKHSGDRVGAATTAAHTGEAFGYFLIAVGVLEFLAFGLIGLWFVFLGWFLKSAARAEQTGVVMRSSMADVHVRDVMTPDPTTFSSTTTVSELMNLQLHGYRFGSYPVVGPDGRLQGLTTLNRIRHLPADRWPTTRLIDIACALADVPVAAPGEPIPGLLERMEGSRDGRALVVDGAGQPVGIVSPSDIARFVQLAMLRSQGRSVPGI
jgi:Zn-dependent protease